MESVTLSVVTCISPLPYIHEMDNVTVLGLGLGLGLGWGLGLATLRRLEVLG
jgi:hypothetical protein